MHLQTTDIEQMDRIRRLNIINSVTGIKPANLVGTRSADGISNLAIFSSVVHLGSNPPVLGMVLRPRTEVRRHTFENLEQSGVYTLNHVPVSHVQAAHQTSAKYDKAVSEFEACGFTEEYIAGFDAPFVAESQLKLGMQLEELVPITTNDTLLVVGRIVHLIAPDKAFDDEGHLDLGQLGSAGISGLNSYYSLKKEAQFPYARVRD